MHYAEVAIASAVYHGNDALTYSHGQQLSMGSIVIVPLRKEQVVGIVMRTVAKPHFAVKPVARVPDLPVLPLPMINLLSWMRLYYPGAFGAITQQFVPKSLPKKPVDVLAFTDPPHPSLPKLTADQQNAIEAINGPGTYLLHGDTGTGKTRVYIELAKKQMAAGKSSLILTPEIGLTSQLAADFRHTFGDRVFIMHSQLTEVTRQRLWVELLKQKEPVILVGARSALFCPLYRLGLIVVDEAHEPAYKQDQVPYYHTSRVAAKLAELHASPMVLGSATPLVTDYYLAKAKKRPILRMQQTASSAHEEHAGTIAVVDLRNRSLFTQKSYLSDQLIKAMQENLMKHEQTLLFLNRRGTARVIFCEQCGWQALCPHCDVPLIYHNDTHTIRCHGCNYMAATPGSCYSCHNASIIFTSIGTKAIVSEVRRLFPEASIMRFDTDNKKHERIEQNYEAVKKGTVDILVGTQTLAKGLDLPKLSLVGVVIADTSLLFPDFSSEERTYQLLSQVVGRIGRGHRASQAVIQTYNPDSPILRSVISKDWQSFYQREIEGRKNFLFPPFCYLLTLTCRRASVQTAEQIAGKLARTLIEAKLPIRIEGPAPAFREKVKNKYQWQLVIKAKDRAVLLAIIDRLPSGWSYDIDPLNLL